MNVKQEYFQLLDLLQEQSNPLPRYEKIYDIVQQPHFQYEKSAATDFVLGVFLKSGYWLDRELFDESYLYSKENQNLSASQMVHIKMVDIGVSLMDKGFPVQYNPSEYTHLGVDQLGPYVKVLVEQIHKKHAKYTSSNRKRSVMSSNAKLLQTNRKLSR